MATPRLSRLHKRILQWLAADHQRTRGFILSSHEELVKALQRDKGTVSRSLRLLEMRGWIVIQILRETPSFRAGRKGGGPCGATAEPSGGVEAPAFRPGRTSTGRSPGGHAP